MVTGSVRTSEQWQPRSWFTLAFGGALGALVAYALARAVATAGEVLVLILLAVFFAVSLEPLVVAMTRRGLPRVPAVAVVVLGLAGLFTAIGMLVVPAVVREVTTLVDVIPAHLQQLQDHRSAVGRLSDRLQLATRAQEIIASPRTGEVALSGLLGAGRFVLSTLAGTAVVVVLFLYFLAGMPQIKRFAYSLVPRGRRERVRAMVEELLDHTGRYMLGNVVTSLVAGLVTFLWCAVTGIPYAAALGVLVALVDLIPVIGVLVGTAVVALVALSVSLPVTVATVVFALLFRLVQDYLVMPRVMKHTVDVPPLVTVLAVLLGGALLGIAGALVAIPVAVALRLLLVEVALPRLEGA